MDSSTLQPCSVGTASSSGLPGSSTLPLAPRPGGLINPKSCHAHGGGAEDRGEMDYEFREEQDRIEECFKKIINAGGLRSAATAFRGYLCRIANNSVRLASVIMGKPGDISPDTHLTKVMTPTKRESMVLQVSVRTFVSTAEEAYHDKVTKETIVSFLGALERLAAMSYFMAQDTLANVGDYKVISLNYGPGFDIDKDRFEYMGKMDALKHGLNMARPYDVDRVVLNTVTDAMIYTLTDAMILTEPFVISMTACRENAVRGLTAGVSRVAAA